MGRAATVLVRAAATATKMVVARIFAVLVLLLFGWIKKAYRRLNERSWSERLSNAVEDGEQTVGGPQEETLSYTLLPKGRHKGPSSSQVHDLGGLIDELHSAPENQHFHSAKSDEPFGL